MDNNNRLNAVQAAINKAMGDLPPLPTLVTKVLQITGSVNGNASDLEKYVSMDQALATKMLRVVNSPYFGISGQVSSISHAIVILGFNQIRNLVLSVGASGMFSIENARAQPIHHEFWKHAMATAACAQAIGRFKKLDSKQNEFAFVAAMLSNVGGLFLLKNLTIPYLQIWERFEAGGRLNLSVFETEAFCIHHAEVGRQLADQWKLPAELVEIIGGHEGPFDPAKPDPALYAVHLADKIATMVCANIDQKGVIAGVDPLAFEWFAAPVEQIELIKAEARLKVEDSAELLSSLAA
jgi:HD-like signal output (HDOD) protein